MDVGSAVVAGLIATLVMTLLMYVAKVMGMVSAMHPRMGAGKALPEPGLFAR